MASNATLVNNTMKEVEEQEEEEAMVDRISQLPDDILYQILYFAGTRKAVQVSILSKRWTHLWSSTPFLNFEVSEFDNDLPSIQSCDLSENSTGHLNPIVNYLDKFFSEFSIQFLNFTLDTFIERFEQIRAANGKKIIKLRIGRFGNSIRRCENMSVYGILLNPGLTELDVNIYCPNGSRNPKVSKMFWSYPEFQLELFPFPRMVHAQEICNYYYNQYPLEMSEELFITENVLINHSDFTYIDLQLKGLKVLKLWHCRTLDGDIQVSAPNLVSLECRQIRASNLKLLDDELPFLEDVVLDMEQVDNEDASNIVMSIFPKIYNAKALTLSTSVLKKLHSGRSLFRHLPTFHNLKNVVVKCEASTQSVGITKDILQLWPNVEKLEIKHNLIKKLNSNIDGGRHAPATDLLHNTENVGWIAKNAGCTILALGLGCAYLYFRRRIILS